MVFCYGSPSRLIQTIVCNLGCFYGHYQSILSNKYLETGSLFVSGLGLASDLLNKIDE